MSLKRKLAFALVSTVWSWAVISYFAEHGWLLPSRFRPFRQDNVTIGYIDARKLHLATCEMDGIQFFPRADGGCYAADAQEGN